MSTIREISVQCTAPAINRAWLCPTEHGYELRFYDIRTGKWVSVSGVANGDDVAISAKNINIDPIDGITATTVQGAILEMYIKNNFVAPSVQIKSSTPTAGVYKVGDSVDVTVKVATTKGSYDIDKIELYQNSVSSANLKGKIENPTSGIEQTFDAVTITSTAVKSNYATFIVQATDSEGNKNTTTTKTGGYSFGLPIYDGIFATSEEGYNFSNITEEWVKNIVSPINDKFYTAINGAITQKTYSTGTTKGYVVWAIPNALSSSNPNLVKMENGVIAYDGFFRKKITLNGYPYDIYTTTERQIADSVFTLNK